MLLTRDAPALATGGLCCRRIGETVFFGIALLLFVLTDVLVNVGCSTGAALKWLETPILDGRSSTVYELDVGSRVAACHVLREQHVHGAPKRCLLTKQTRDVARLTGTLAAAGLWAEDERFREIDAIDGYAC